MHPILLKFGPFTLYSYGAMMVAAFLTSTWLVAREARRMPPLLRAISADQLVDYISVTLLSGIVGARVFFVALQWDSFKQMPQEWPAIWHGGLVWYGGLVGGLVGGWCYVRAQRLNYLRVLDQFIPFGALGHAIGRVGCFLNGCCYGRPTASWCGVRFPGHPEPLIPTQLIEAAGLVILFIVLRRFQRPQFLRHSGWVFGCYLIGYGVLRIGVEALRGDQTSWWFGLTLQQLISLVVLAVGLVLLLRSSRRQLVSRLP